MTFKVAICGSRYFGATVLEALRQETGVQISCVVAPAEDDRLALAARAAGIPVHVQANPKVIAGEAIAEGSDLIVAAHTHARVSDEALARARLGGVGYHPSLLPRHRGIAAVEWTILAGDPIAGGSVYHLADGWDAGAIAAQDWCFVAKNDTARTLWERELAPMGLRLLAQVVRHARDHGSLPAKVQDTSHATKAPMLRRAVVLTEDAAPATASLVLTVIGPDRPGIVSLIADRAQRFGASWTDSRMANLAGEFAGMVHFDVPPENLDPLAAALQGLESSGLRVTLTKTRAAGASPLRGVAIELVGDDRVGIVSQLTRMLADRNISIEYLHTELVHSEAPGGKKTFKVNAHLQMPKTVSVEELKRELGTLANELMLDIGLGGPATN